MATGSTGVLYSCAGNGLCAANGTCYCTYGFHGDACEYECPGGSTNVCNGNGQCTSLGSCDCYSGFFGPTCAGICPGGVSNPCSNRGTCNNLGQCACFANTVAGFFGGNACEECRTGYSGPTCLDPCNPTTASTVNQKCVCNPSYAGPDCTIACPRTSVDGICDNHGTCRDGNDADGTCACDATYYGTACTIQCSPSICLDKYKMVNSMCHSTTGTCMCLQNGSYFSGATCERCSDGYWGVVCNLPCNCNLHGYCKQYTGECVCYADNTHGYWTGTGCTKCVAGYMGGSCLQRNMQLSTNSNSTGSVRITSFTAPSQLTRGFGNMFISAGSQPVLFFNSSTDGQRQTFYGSVDVGGSIVGSRPSSTAPWVDIWTISNTTTNQLERKRIYFTNISNVVVMATLVDLGTTGNSFSVSRRHVETLAAFEGYASKFVFDADAQALVSFSNSGGANTSSLSITSLATGATTTFNTTITRLIWVQFDKAGAMVTISGSTYDDLWEADVFTISSTGVTTLLMELSNTTRSVPLCGNTTNRCTAATLCAYYASLDEIFCILRREGDGAVYAAFPMNTAATSALTSMVLYSLASDDFNVTAIAEDTYFKILVVAINFAGGSSTVLQINGTYPSSILSQLDAPSSSVVQIVSSMFVDQPSRSLYIIRQAEFTVTMYQVNLFGVTDISPSILDSSGSTPVTIKGYGFGPLHPLECNFGRTAVSNATVIDNYTIECNTTVEDLGGSGCAILYFNLVSGTRRTDATNTPITRIAGVTLEQAVNADGLVGATGLGAATTITLVGFGFISSQWATCRMVDANGTIITDLNPVTYLNGNAASCTMPPIFTATMPPTYIEYSHDGVVYSPSRADFAVVGLAYDIVGGFEDSSTGDILDSDNAIFVSAQRETTIPSIIGFLVDRNGNRRGALETVSTRFLATTAVNTGESETLNFNNASFRTVAMVDGIVRFNNIILDLPLMGTYTIFLRSLVYTGLDTSVTFTVVAGSPYRVSMLNVSRMLSVWTIPVSTPTVLQPSPVVVIVDVAGNRITDTSVLPVQVVLQYANAYLNSTTGDVYYRTVSAASIPDETGEYTFTGVSVQTVYDSSFVISFQASVELGNSPIGSYLTPVIPTAKCVPDVEYAVAFTFTCRQCPEFGICDGSSTVTPMEGYWRGSQASYKFYSCAPPDGNDACARGIASCDDGYVGPRCSSCAAGYGKSGSACAPCLDSSFNWGMSWLIFFIIVGFTSFLVIRSIMDVSQGVAQEKTVIVVKGLVTHAQVLGALVALLDVQDMPGFFAQFFQAGGQAYVKMNLSFFSCAIAPDALDAFIFALVIPWVLCAFVAIVALSRGSIMYYLGYRVEAARHAFREKRIAARAKKSMFHKSSESYDILASIGNHHIDIDNIDAPDDVDPHELAIYRMEAFGDDQPSTEDEDDEFGVMHSSQSLKEKFETPMPLTGSRGAENATPKTFELPPLKIEQAEKNAVAHSSAMTSIHQRKASIKRLKKEEGEASRSVLRSNSRRVIRIIDGPNDESQTGTSTPTPLSPTRPALGTQRNPLDLCPNPLAGKPAALRVFNDGGDAEVSAASTDPAGFGAVDTRSKQNPDEVDAIAERVKAIEQSAKFSIRAGASDLSHKFTPNQGALGTSDKAVRALASFRESARRAILEKSNGTPRTFSRGLSFSASRLKEAARAAKTGQLGKRKAGGKPSEFDAPQYIATFGFPLPIYSASLSVQSQIVHTIALIFLVVMFLLYPTMINACLSLFPCEEIDYGTYSQSVLIAERTVNCKASWFQPYRTSAGLMLLVYGLGVPAAAIGLVHFLRVFTLNGNMEAAKTVFYFATGGFRKTMWFWESVTMLRKASILIIVTMLTDETERRYVASVGMTLFFILNWFARPFGDKVLHTVETISLLDIAITTNLFMLFPFFPYESNPLEYMIVVVAVFVVNMMTLLVFAYGVFTSAADALFKTSLYVKMTQPSPKEVLKRHQQVVAGLESTRRMCRVVHPRTYEMDEFLYEAYSLAVLGNTRLEKMGKEVVSHTRRLRKHARRTGEEETVVANLVSSMLLPTTTAFETKLRDVLEDATNAIVYVGAMRAFASTQVQQALSSTDGFYMEKVGDCLEELYRAEINVLKTSKKLRKALRRLGGSAGEFREELSSDSNNSDDEDIFADEDENSPKAVAQRAKESESMFRDYEEERRALNSNFHFDQTSVAESDVFSDEASRNFGTDKDDDEYFSMMEQKQSTIARRLHQHASPSSSRGTTTMLHHFHDDRSVDAVPVVAQSDEQNPTVQTADPASESGYAFGTSDPYATLFHTPDDREDEVDYMAILEAGRARERTSSVRRYSSFKGR